MRLSLNIIFLSVFCISVYSQSGTVYQKGIVAEDNLKIIGALSPYASGGFGFDNRYEGVRGSPRLYDTLLPSFLRIKGQDAYIPLKSDIDLLQNSVIYMHPGNAKLFLIPASDVEEIIIKRDGKELLFRTTSGRLFEKEMKEQKFIQILNEGPVQFIKVPGKLFVQADFKRAYSADRRYDEFHVNDKYFLLGPDNIFHQIQLTAKSVIKIYPGKKSLIEKMPDEKSFPDKEEMILEMLEKF